MGDPRRGVERTILVRCWRNGYRSQLRRLRPETLPGIGHRASCLGSRPCSDHHCRRAPEIPMELSTVPSTSPWARQRCRCSPTDGSARQSKSSCELSGRLPGPIAGGSARDTCSASDGTWAVHPNAVRPLRLCRSEPAVCPCPSRADRERRGPRNLPFAVRSGPSSQ